MRNFCKMVKLDFNSTISMQIIAVKTPLFKEKDNVLNFIFDNIVSLEDGDIVAITSKVVALSQGRVGKLKDKKNLIAKNSKKIIETPWAFMTLTDEGWCINAGIDESNANHKLILLPKHILKTAEFLRKRMMRHFSLKKLGILITDTKSLPLRAGTIGRTVGYAGFKPLKSYIGKKDLFGKKSRFTQSNIADALSASAVLLMGEGDEKTPIVIIKNALVEFTHKSTVHKKNTQLSILPEKDIYSYIYKNKK